MKYGVEAGPMVTDRAAGGRAGEDVGAKGEELGWGEWCRRMGGRGT